MRTFVTLERPIGILDIEATSATICCPKERKDKRFEKWHTGEKPELIIDRYDGWKICITLDTHYNEDFLIVTRYYQDLKGNIINRQYLTKSLKWVDEPTKSGPLPDDAVRIPLFID